MIKNWKEIEKRKKNYPLLFIHTPKCGGSYVNTILKDLNIKRNGHHQATNKDKERYITFTVVREPVERFESFLNYRLGEKRPRWDWPNYIRNAYRNKNITLNQIVTNFQEEDIHKLHPYKNLKFWTRNIDIIITVKQLHSFLSFFGFKYNIKKYEKRNVSKKIRGTFNKKSKEKIKNIFIEDINLYNQFILK